ncbi:MAG: hypothetical protein ABIT01_10035 [Thermoanaerobaculia bacterium]
MKSLRILAVLLVFLDGVATAQSEHSTGAIHGCPPGGKGGGPSLSALKNRDVALEKFEVLALTDVRHLCNGSDSGLIAERGQHD